MQCGEPAVDAVVGFDDGAAAVAASQDAAAVAAVVGSKIVAVVVEPIVAACDGLLLVDAAVRQLVAEHGAVVAPPLVSAFAKRLAAADTAPELLVDVSAALLQHGAEPLPLLRHDDELLPPDADEVLLAEPSFLDAFCIPLALL